MQRSRELGVGGRKLVAEELAEEVVVAIPLALRVERDEEEVRALELAQHQHRAGPGGHGVAEWGTEALEHGRLEQEAPHVLGKAGEYLCAQVVDNVPVVAREGLDELVCVLASPKGQRREVETSRPSFGQLPKPDDVPVLEPEPV